MAKKKSSTNTETPELSNEKLQGLRKWNLRLSALFAAQAIAIVIIGTVMSYPVTTQYLAVDVLASEATGGQTLATASRHLFDIRLGWVIAAFLGAFAAAHLAVATVYRKRYEQRMQLGMNDARWGALGVGGGLLLVATGLISGISSMILLVAMLVFTVMGCLALLAAEEMVRRSGNKKEGLLSHLVCAVGMAGVVAPLVILVNAAGGTLLFDGELPGFVWGVYATILVVFGLIFWLSHHRFVHQGRWADTHRTERAYMLLGLLGASAVAWQMFAGALLP